MMIANPLKILIVDDEVLALDRLEALFARIDGVTLVGRAEDGPQALAQAAALSPDVIFLDVQMPGRDGLAVAAALDRDPRPEIVFVTAHDCHAPAAFEVDAVDYLLKPVHPDRLAQAVERARRRHRVRARAASADRLAAENDRLRGASPAESDLWVPERQGMRRVPIASIGWIEAARDYVLLHTAERSHMLRTTMAALEETLAGSALLRIHRSAFVRPDRIARVLRSGRSVVVVLVDGAEVQVGPSYIERLDAALGRTSW